MTFTLKTGDLILGPSPPLSKPKPNYARDAQIRSAKMGNQFCACDQKTPTSYNLDLPTSPSTTHSEYYTSRIGERRVATESPSIAVKKSPMPSQLALNQALEKLKAEMVQRVSPQHVRKDRFDGSFELPRARRRSPPVARLSESPIHNPAEYSAERKSDLTQEASITLDRTSRSEQTPAEIVWEGSLLKYKPGLSANFIQRWCQITNSSFRYYKNQWCARVWESKPLFSASLSLIQEARRYRPTSDEKLAVFGPNHQYLFELVLTEQGKRALTPERTPPADGKSRHRWSTRATEWDAQHLLFSAKSLEDCSQWIVAFTLSKRSL